MAIHSKVSVHASPGAGNKERSSVEMLIRLLEEQNNLTRDLVQLAEERNTLADRRTQDAQLRTALSQKRTDLTERQTERSIRSTELAEQRTRYAETRTKLAETRTSDSGIRNDLANTRTGLSGYRSVLAKGRTELALVRTGLAFVALGAGLMRYFGLGAWTVLDGSFLLAGMGMAVYGLRGFAVMNRKEKRFGWKGTDISSFQAPPRVAGKEE